MSLGVPTGRTCERELRSAHDGLAADPHLATIDEIDPGVEDHLIARFDTIAQLQRRSLIARHRYISDMHDAAVDHGDLQAVAVEDDCFGRHQHRVYLARDMQLDRAIDPRCQRPIGIRNVNLGK